MTILPGERTTLVSEAIECDYLGSTTIQQKTRLFLASSSLSAALQGILCTSKVPWSKVFISYLWAWCVHDLFQASCVCVVCVRLQTQITTLGPLERHTGVKEATELGRPWIPGLPYSAHDHTHRPTQFCLPAHRVQLQRKKTRTRGLGGGNTPGQGQPVSHGLVVYQLSETLGMGLESSSY